jgi:hypothetical protein
VTPPLVLPEHRPTLVEELARLRRAAVALVVGVAAALLIAVLLLVLRSDGDEVEYVQRAPIAFNFRAPPELRPARRDDGAYVRLVRHRADGLFLDSFAVSPLALPAYRGDPSGLLPLFADREIARLRGAHREFELLQEGKARINEVPGYMLGFRARQGRRLLLGRVVLLPEPVPRPRRGVRLELLSTPAAGVGSVDDVVSQGAAKMPYRTFRFGTEKP